MVRAKLGCDRILMIFQKHRTPNIEHRTPNVLKRERRGACLADGHVRPTMLDLEFGLLNSMLGTSNSNFSFFL
jgi:hypothetical protein